MDILDIITELGELIPLGIIIAVFVGIAQSRSKKRKEAPKNPPADIFQNPPADRGQPPAASPYSPAEEEKDGDIWATLGKAIGGSIDLSTFAEQTRKTVEKARGNTPNRVKKETESAPPAMEAPAMDTSMVYEGLRYEALEYAGLQTEMRESAASDGPGNIAAQAAGDQLFVERDARGGQPGGAYIPALGIKMDTDALRQAVVMKEILDKPRCLRRMTWRSRY